MPVICDLPLPNSSSLLLNRPNFSDESYLDNSERYLCLFFPSSLPTTLRLAFGHQMMSIILFFQQQQHSMSQAFASTPT